MSTPSKSTTPAAPDPALFESAAAELAKLRDTLGEVLFGQERLIELTLTGLLSRGHILLEGLPGLGKTELVKGLSRALKLEARRIQFTPDLLPGDITGNPILQDVDGERRFIFQRGPVFANILLADEINRASPKTQSALLEAMQEGCVSVMGESHRLPAPFFVLATQNPIELEGTYPLPEAQLDRFLFKLTVGRTTRETLCEIIRRREIGKSPDIPEVLDAARLDELIALASRIHLPDPVVSYIARIVDASHGDNSRTASLIRYGASPRAALALAAAAKSAALLRGNHYASYEDVQAVAVPVLQHRLVLEYEARIEGRTGASVAADLLAEIDPLNAQLPDSLQVTATANSNNSPTGGKQ